MPSVLAAGCQVCRILILLFQHSLSLSPAHAAAGSLFNSLQHRLATGCCFNSSVLESREKAGGGQLTLLLPIYTLLHSSVPSIALFLSSSSPPLLHYSTMAADRQINNEEFLWSVFLQRWGYSESLPLFLLSLSTLFIPCSLALFLSSMTFAIWYHQFPYKGGGCLGYHGLHLSLTQPPRLSLSLSLSFDPIISLTVIGH